MKLPLAVLIKIRGFPGQSTSRRRLINTFSRAVNAALDSNINNSAEIEWNIRKLELTAIGQNRQ